MVLVSMLPHAELGRNGHREYALHYKSFYVLITIHFRYNRQDPETGIREITTGFRKWAFRYLNECKAQNQHQLQKIRMEKWRTNLTAKFLYFKEKMTADE